MPRQSKRLWVCRWGPDVNWWDGLSEKPLPPHVRKWLQALDDLETGRDLRRSRRGRPEKEEPGA